LKPSEGPAGAAERSAAGARLRELAGLFLRLGLTAFGGPAAHIALLEDEVVTRRGWMKREEFLDLLGATNLIPGPNSTEMAIHIGRARAGALGLLVAGISFIAPAAGLVSLIAWAYLKYGSLPETQAILHGIKPVIIAIVLQALLRLGRSAIKTPLLAAAALAALALAFAGVDELVVLFGIGGGVALATLILDRKRGSSPLLLAGAALPAPSLGIGAGGVAVLAAAAFSRTTLFLVFLKIGAVLFGSGYVLLAFIRADLVERLGWLSESQLLDAVAVGQMTPGPLFTTATFIGYVLDGPVGAALATVGIFLPAFVFVALSAPFIPRMRRSRFFGAALDGVNAASLALMAEVTWQIARSMKADLLTTIIFVASAALLLRYRINSTWLILGGAAAGLAIQGFR
jgi:chromate transporter